MLAAEDAGGSWDKERGGIPQDIVFRTYTVMLHQEHRCSSDVRLNAKRQCSDPCCALRIEWYQSGPQLRDVNPFPIKAPLTLNH